MSLLIRGVQGKLAGARLSDNHHTQNAVLLLLLTFFIVLSILSSPGVSVTSDEPVHFYYGVYVLEGKTDRIDDSSMPVLALNALPKAVASSLPDGALKSLLERAFVARLVTILFSAAVAALIFRWARALYGSIAAMFSTVLYILDPNVIANSLLVTTDIYAVGMIALTFYLLWKFANSRKAVDGLLCACVLGLSQLVKYTAIALFPLALLVLVVHDWPAVREAMRRSRIRAAASYLGQLTMYMLVAVAVSVVIINAGFLFNRTFTPFKDYQFRSDVFRSLQARLPALGNVPVPVPYPFLDGLDWMSHTNQTADRYGNIYLLGRLSRETGIPGYYFVASALKVPIASQLFILAALVLYFVIPRRRAQFFRDGAFFLIPFTFFTIYFNFFFNAQTGMRYYLVVFPLLYVLVGSLFAEWQSLPFAVKAASFALVGYLMISVLSYFPYFTPYFNEIVWDKTQTYRYLADSNLEWGQSTGDLLRYLSEHPDAVYAPASVQPGLLVVSGSDLAGIAISPQRYAWLRDNFKPAGTVAYGYFIYRISPEEITKLCSSTSYCK